jgi:hypothetical protein
MDEMFVDANKIYCLKKVYGTDMDIYRFSTPRVIDEAVKLLKETYCEYRKSDNYRELIKQSSANNSKEFNVATTRIILNMFNEKFANLDLDVKSFQIKLEILDELKDVNKCSLIDA